MIFDEKQSRKKSLGGLRKNHKTKHKSPDFVGQIDIQRKLFDLIAKQFAASGADEVKCNIAAWCNRDYEGELVLSVELSPRYSHQFLPVSADDLLDLLGNQDEGTQ